VVDQRRWYRCCKGLISGEWAGDINLNDGKLGAQYKQYQDKISWLKGIGLCNKNIENIKQDLLKTQDDISAEPRYALLYASLVSATSTKELQHNIW